MRRPQIIGGSGDLKVSSRKADLIQLFLWFWSNGKYTITIPSRDLNKFGLDCRKLLESGPQHEVESTINHPLY